MISLTPLNVIIEVCVAFFITAVFIFNIKRELK